MEFENITGKKSRRRLITVSSVFLALYVGMAFVLHLFVYALPSQMYIVTVWVFALFYIISKPLRLRTDNKKFLYIWLIVLIVMASNYFFVYRTNTTLIDLFVLASGLLIITFFSEKPTDYNVALKYIMFFSAFFAIGSLLQFIVPSIYRLVIRMFPTGLAREINADAVIVKAYRGFTTNTGFTASYITVGLMALFGRRHEQRKMSIGSIGYITILVFALLLTGKRGIILFLIISIIFCSIIPQRGKKKYNRMWGAFVGISLFIILFLTFEDLLADVPLFREAIETINGWTAGEDVSSGRSSLYAWAIQQIIKHPINGIGWNRFRETIIGHVTIRAKLDVHNVYLQLLCETGIIGFISFCMIFITGWIIAKRAYCNCLSEKCESLTKWRPALFFAFVYETFFLLYCLTGNPLYDQVHQIMYVFSWAIVIAYRHAAQYYNVYPKS